MGNTPTNAPYEGKLVERLVLVVGCAGARGPVPAALSAAPTRQGVGGPISRCDGQRRHPPQEPSYTGPRGARRGCSSTATPWSPMPGRSCSMRSWNDRPAVCVLYDEGAPPGESSAAEERRRRALRGARGIRCVPSRPRASRRSSPGSSARRPSPTRWPRRGAVSFARWSARSTARGRADGRRDRCRSGASRLSDPAGSVRRGLAQPRSTSKAAGGPGRRSSSGRTPRVHARVARIPARGGTRPRDVSARGISSSGRARSSLPQALLVRAPVTGVFSEGVPRRSGRWG